MTITPYDQKLLEFIHHLTKNRRFMNSYELSRKITINNEKVTDRSIRRWLNYLNKNYFWYFPYVKYEIIGLSPVLILIENLKNNEFLKIIPYQTYIMPGINANTFKKSFMLLYAIPPANLNDLKYFFINMHDLKMIDNFYMFKIKTPINFYSPFHKLFNKDGYLSFPDNIAEQEYDFFYKLLYQRLGESNKIYLHRDIIKNPIVIPILLEYFREYFSSTKIWFNLKKKLGEDVWNYFLNQRLKKKTDNTGIKILQNIIKYLNYNFNSFFQQTRVFYRPLYSTNSIGIFITLKIKKSIKEFCTILAKNSMELTIMLPSANSNISIIYLVTNSQQLPKVLNICSGFADTVYPNRFVLRDYNESLGYWRKDRNYRQFLKIDYRNFNPITCTWKYESEKYLNTLKLARNNSAS